MSLLNGIIRYAETSRAKENKGMASGTSEKGRTIRLSTELFLHVELVVYVALGILLSVTALLSLGSAALLQLEGMRDWSGTRAIFLIVDRLMFVLMLIEILHSVRGSVRSGTLTPEPFLIIGLIASIRNVLVITLKSSEMTSEGHGAIESEMLFRSSIVELAVLGALILIFNPIPTFLHNHFCSNGGATRWLRRWSCAANGAPKYISRSPRDEFRRIASLRSQSAKA
jgi:hypothetical protein